jgi:hypothetical protein
MSRNIDYSTIRLFSKDDVPDASTESRAETTARASAAANDAVKAYRSSKEQQENDDGSELVREILSEFPPEERGEREEWQSREGWHRKEDTQRKEDIQETRKSSRRQEKQSQEQREKGDRSRDPRKPMRRRNELSFEPLEEALTNQLNEALAKQMIHESLQREHIEAVHSISSSSAESNRQNRYSYGELRGSKVLLPLAGDYSHDTEDRFLGHSRFLTLFGLNLAFVALVCWGRLHRRRPNRKSIGL